MLRFNTFRSERYLRSKFVEGKYLLASEATDLELEVLDLLRKVVSSTLGDVAIEDAFKVERYSDTQILIKPGQAWFKGLPYAMRGGKDQLVSGAVLSVGTVPVGTVATDDSTGLGKIITFNSGSTTPTNLYRIVITAKEELLTEVDDPFLQNVNLTESTAQKIRLNFQLNIVPDSLQTESPIPYRDETSASGSVTDFPNVGGMAAPNFVNQISVTPTAAGNGELVALNLISGSEGIDGRDLELVIRNNSGLGGGIVIPNSPSTQQAFSNGKLIDSYGNKYHVNAIFNDTVSTQVVIRIDKEPDQPNPQIINTLPFILVKREVYVTDDSNGLPQGRLHWSVATLDWDSTDGVVHDSKVVDLRTSVSKQETIQKQLIVRDNLEMVGGGNVSFDINTGILSWPEDFNIVNPHGPLQTIDADSAPLIDGGSLAYEMDLENGGSISRGVLGVTVSSGGTTATLSSVDLSNVRLGNILIDSNGDMHVITAIDNVNDTVSAVSSIATGSANIYMDAFGPEMAPVSENAFILAVRSGNDVLVGGDENEITDTGDRNLKLVRGGTWESSVSNGTPIVSHAYNDLGSATVHSNSVTSTWYGQSFYTLAPGDITDIEIFIASSGATGTAVVRIYDDGGAIPGTLLGTSDTFDLSDIPTSIPAAATTVHFSSPVTISSNTTYWYAIDITNKTSGTIDFQGATSSNYSNGNAVNTTNSGANWTAESSNDLNFFVYGFGSGSNPVIEHEQLSNLQSLGTFSSTPWIGLGWDVHKTFDITSVVFNLTNSGAATGTLSVDLYDDNAGDPGSILATSSTINVATIPGTQTDETFTFASPVTLTAGQRYYLIMKVTGGASLGALSSYGVNIHVENVDIVFSVTNGATWGLGGGSPYCIVNGNSLTVGGTTTLSWSEDAFISIPGLTESRNTIPVGSVDLENDGEVAYVFINRDPGIDDNLSISVDAIEDVIPSEDLLVIARRIGDDIIVGNQSTLLEPGQSSKLYAQMSDQMIAFMGGGPSESTDYSNENYISDGDSLEDAVGILDNEIFSLSGTVAAIPWKDSVANFAALPGSGNTDGDVRLVLDTRVIYSWKSSTTAWVETGRWKSPVANVAALPTLNNLDGDVRITLDTRVAYHWEQSTTSWKPLNGTGGGVKIIGGGTISWAAPNLTFTADMYLEIKGLDYTDNTIPFSSESPIALATSLDVAYVLPNLSTGGPALNVVVDTLDQVPANAIIIARREGTSIIVGSSSTRLLSGQSSSLYAQASDQNLTYIGATDTADDSPTYSSNNYVSNGDDLTTAIGDLDAAVAGKIGSVAEDTDPELGGDLDVSGFAIEGASSPVLLAGQNSVRRAKQASKTDYVEEEYIHSIGLPGSQTNATITAFTFAYATTEAIEITYKMKQSVSDEVRMGTFRVVTNGSAISYLDTYIESSSLGISLDAVISGSNVIVRLTSGLNGAIMRADVKKFLT